MQRTSSRPSGPVAVGSKAPLLFTLPFHGLERSVDVLLADHQTVANTVLTAWNQWRNSRIDNWARVRVTIACRKAVVWVASISAISAISTVTTVASIGAVAVLLWIAVAVHSATTIVAHSRIPAQRTGNGEIKRIQKLAQSCKFPRQWLNEEPLCLRFSVHDGEVCGSQPPTYLA